MHYRKSVQSVWGIFIIEANDKGLTRVIFPDDAICFSDTEQSTLLLDSAIQQFINYFSGKPYDFRNLRYDFSAISKFQEKVLFSLLNLPVKTMSYSELAQISGSPRASRAVGNAMNQNPFPILIPCHRVIRADGDLGQYAWGQIWKERLLRHEKIHPDNQSEPLSDSLFSAIIAAV